MPKAGSSTVKMKSRFSGLQVEENSAGQALCRDLHFDAGRPLPEVKAVLEG
jgi:hypothetical protein